MDTFKLREGEATVNIYVETVVFLSDRGYFHAVAYLFVKRSIRHLLSPAVRDKQSEDRIKVLNTEIYSFLHSSAANDRAEAV